MYFIPFSVTNSVTQNFIKYIVFQSLSLQSQKSVTMALVTIIFSLLLIFENFWFTIFQTNLLTHKYLFAFRIKLATLYC